MLKKLVLLLSLAPLTFAVTVPRPAGDVPFTIPGKGADNVTNYRGKPVVLMVFITTCPHCQRATKVLSGIYNDFKKPGLNVIGLAFRPDDDEAALKKFAEEYKPSYPIGMIDANLLAKFGELTPEIRPTVPMLFFIDRNGTVVGEYFGADPFMDEKFQDENIRAKVMNIVGSGPSPSPRKRPAKPQ
jgi:peroxiredoxin